MKSSIRTKLALALGACMALIVAAGAALSWSLVREEVRADVEKHLFALTAEVAHEIEGDIDAALRTAAGIAAAIPAAALDRPAELDAYFRLLPTPLGWLDRCVAAAADGRILAQSGPPSPGATANLGGREYFRRALAEAKPVVSMPLLGGISKAPVIVLAAPRADAEGRIRVVVACSLGLMQRGVLGHVRELKIGRSGYVYVATRERKIVLHPDARRMLGDSPPPGANPLADRAGEGFEGTAEGTNSAGLRAVMSFRQIPSLGWFVAAVYPVEEAYQTLHELRGRILLVALAALALSAALAWFLAGWLVRPLQRLTRHVARLREHPGEALPPLPPRPDEIGELTDAFGGLLGDLRQREESLRQTEERFAKAFHSNPDFSMISRLRDGRIVEVNEGFEALLGISAAEAVGKLSVADLQLWADAAEREQFTRLLAEQGRVRDLPATFRSRDGRLRAVEITASTIDLAGEPHIIGTARDVTDLKQSQAALRRSEERFAMFFRNNPDYATVSRLADGCFVDVNRAFETMTGWQRADVLGRTAMDIGLYVDPREREWLVGQLEAHGVVRDFELHFRMRSGEVRLVQGAVVRVELDGEPHILGVARDITQVRRAEAALAKSEEKFSKAFHASPDWITVFRLEDGMIIETNERIAALCGYAADEAVGRTTLELGLWAYPEKRPRFVEALRSKGWVTDYPWDLQTRSGEIRDTRISAATIAVDGVPCMISIVRDATEQLRAERAIRTSEEKFSKVFHASPDWIVVVRLEDGLILDANEGFARISGLSLEAAIGRTVGELGIWVYPEMRTRFVRELRANGSVVDYEWEFHGKGGAVREGLIAAVAIELDGVPCLISIVRDVTDQRRAEAEILSLNASLESRVRERTAELEGALRELESFSYSISHDLRSPLRAIAGYARIIGEDYAPMIDAEGNRLLGRIVGGAIRMSELIDDLLDFSRIGRAELRKVPIEMTSLVREVLGEMPEAGSGHHLQMAVAALPAAVADRGLMRQVWTNLLSNAIKYSRQRDPMVIEVGGSVVADEAHFFVRDNGAGFDMQYAGKLFQVFQRLHRDPAFEGTGVGLAIVARIVQRHGGRVWAEAEPDKGATFHFALPLGAG